MIWHTMMMMRSFKSNHSNASNFRSVNSISSGYLISCIVFSTCLNCRNLDENWSITDLRNSTNCATCCSICSRLASLNNNFTLGKYLKAPLSKSRWNVLSFLSKHLIMPNITSTDFPKPCNLTFSSFRCKEKSVKNMSLLSQEKSFK